MTVVAHHTILFSIVHKANNKIIFKAPYTQIEDSILIDHVVITVTWPRVQ
jgi:hypothetical protein